MRMLGLIDIWTWFKLFEKSSLGSTRKTWWLNGWHYRIYLCLKWLRRWVCCNRGIFLFKIWLISIYGFLMAAIVFVYSWPQDKNMRPKLWLPTTRILPLKIKTSLCHKRKYRENLYKSGVKAESHLFSVINRNMKMI